jgi:hypothetical protein
MGSSSELRFTPMNYQIHQKVVFFKLHLLAYLTCYSV